MQKFTVFTIILSLTILMVLGDLVAHDYLKNNVTALPEAVQTGPQVPALVQADEIPTEEVLPVETETEVLVPVSDVGWLGESPETFSLLGFVAPVLKTTQYSGLLFDFIPFDTATGGQIQSWNLFDGERYVGNVTEVHFGTDTAAFQAYLQMRQTAQSESSLGSVNESNNAGDASFYFNHLVKTKTVHRVVLTGERLIVLMYSYSDHERMKNLFDFL